MQTHKSLKAASVVIIIIIIIIIIYGLLNHAPVTGSYKSNIV
jgi:hypothetical protein